MSSRERDRDEGRERQPNLRPPPLSPFPSLLSPPSLSLVRSSNSPSSLVLSPSLSLPRTPPPPLLIHLFSRRFCRFSSPFKRGQNLYINDHNDCSKTAAKHPFHMLAFHCFSRPFPLLSSPFPLPSIPSITTQFCAGHRSFHWLVPLFLSFLSLLSVMRLAYHSYNQTIGRISLFLTPITRIN